MTDKKVENTEQKEEKIADKKTAKTSNSKKAKKETKTSKAFKKLENDYKVLQEKYETAILETQKANEKMLRVVAEYDNMKKRQSKEAIRMLEYEKRKMAKAFLPVVDNLERSAIFEANQNGGEDNKDGVKLVLEQFKKILKDEFEVAPFESKGFKFDPEKHDAMTMVQSDEESGTIVDEYEKGYYMGETVLRHAKVVVSE